MGLLFTGRSECQHQKMVTYGWVVAGSEIKYTYQYASLTMEFTGLVESQNKWEQWVDTWYINDDQERTILIDFS